MSMTITDSATRSDGEVVVSVRGLTKVFKDFWGRPKARAVDNVDFEVRRGEVFGLLGPNGSGKSTTVKLMLGLLYPTKGHIEVFGHSPRHVATKSRIGYLPEESYLYRYLDSHETLEFFGNLFRLPRKDRQDRAEQLLEMVGLSQTRMRAVGEFSKGMQRRIGLAQALINDPDLVILDEPTSGLDPIGCREVKDLIVALARRGKTVILSSHLLADVEDVCDRVVIYYGGKVQAMGTLKELLATPDCDSDHHSGAPPRNHGAGAGDHPQGRGGGQGQALIRRRRTWSATSSTWCRAPGRPRRRPPAPCPAPASPLTCAARRKPSRRPTRFWSGSPRRKPPRRPPSPRRRRWIRGASRSWRRWRSRRSRLPPRRRQRPRRRDRLSDEELRKADEKLASLVKKQNE